MREFSFFFSLKVSGRKFVCDSERPNPLSPISHPSQANLKIKISAAGKLMFLINNLLLIAFRKTGSSQLDVEFSTLKSGIIFLLIRPIARNPT